MKNNFPLRPPFVYAADAGGGKGRGSRHPPAGQQGHNSSLLCAGWSHRITGSQKPPQCLVPAAVTSLGHSRARRLVRCCGFGQQPMEAMANQTPKPQPAAAQFKGPGSALETAASSVRAPRRSEGPCGRPRQPPFRTAELSFRTGGPSLPLPFHLGPGLFFPCFLLLSNC